MTCKDCLHYEACKGTYFTFEPITNKDSFDSEHYADVYDCSDFTDRSEWVHLPCKVGDTIYKLWYAPCHLGETYPDSYNCEGCLDECDIEKVITEYKVPSLRFIVDELMNDSCVYYLTREEAEKVMERMKENEENTI